MFKVNEMADIERIYTIPLNDARKVPRWKRAESAARKVRQFLSKHLKTDLKEVKIDRTVNEKALGKRFHEAPIESSRSSGQIRSRRRTGRAC